MTRITTIKPLRSDTSGNSPTTVDGELTIQRADKRILMSNATATFDAMQNTVSNIAISSATGQYFVGNSTVNSISNSTAFILANSTVTWSLIKPTAAQVTDTAYFPASDGTWKKPAGGSGSPGGSNTNIQINDSGSFYGSNNFNWDKSSNTMSLSGNLVANADYISVGNSTVNLIVNSIALILPAQGANNISAPASGLAIFDKTKAGRNFPVSIGAAGWDTPFQGHFVHNTIYQMTPAASTVAVVIRMTSANTVAFTARVTSSANLFMSQTRVGQTTGTVAGASTSWRNGTGLPWWRGNGVALGGFYAACRFGVAAHTTNGRAFIGFKDSTTIIANGNPSAQTNMIGFSYDSADTTWKAISANSTAANTIDTGMDCTTGNTYWYEGVIYAPPNGGTAQYQLTCLNNGNVASGSYNQTNLPTTTTMLTWQFWNNNGADSAANIMDWGGVQIEVNL